MLGCGGVRPGPACVLCRSIATLYCRDDDAFLCAACDLQVHGCSALLASHTRVPTVQGAAARQLVATACNSASSQCTTEHQQQLPLAACYLGSRGTQPMPSPFSFGCQPPLSMPPPLPKVAGGVRLVVSGEESRRWSALRQPGAAQPSDPQGMSAKPEQPFDFAFGASRLAVPSGDHTAVSEGGRGRSDDSATCTAAPGPSSSCSDSQPGSTRPSPTAAAAASAAAAGPECFFLECQRELLQQDQPEASMQLAPAGDSSSAGSSLARWQAGGEALAAPRSPHHQLQQQQVAQQPQRMQTADAQQQLPAQLSSRATLPGSCSWLVTTGLGSGGASALPGASAAPASPGAAVLRPGLSAAPPAAAACAANLIPLPTATSNPSGTITVAVIKGVGSAAITTGAATAAAALQRHAAGGAEGSRSSVPSRRQPARPAALAAAAAAGGSMASLPSRLHLASGGAADSTDAGCDDIDGISLIPYRDGESRADKLARYRAKKARRRFQKTVRYECRKHYADKRPRIKGRFVSPEEFAAWEQQEQEGLQAGAAVAAC